MKEYLDTGVVKDINTSNAVSIDILFSIQTFRLRLTLRSAFTDSKYIELHWCVCVKQDGFETSSVLKIKPQ